jgi:hypothetical protein
MNHAASSDGVDKKTINTVMDMHAKLIATVEFNDKISQPFNIKNGIRQDDILAPRTFILVINIL